MTSPQAARCLALFGSSVTVLFLLFVIGVITGHQEKFPVFPTAPVPSTWDPIKEAHLLKAISIGIISTPTYHKNVRQGAMESWWTEARRSIAVVSTDRYHLSKENQLPNMLVGDCDSSYNVGLWCKNGQLIDEWQTPEYDEKMWFVRVMDDSYLHLENLYDTLMAIDASKVHFIGDLWCVAPNQTYPSGGGAMIFSRGFINAFNWESWNRPIYADLPDVDFLDDTLWGQYLSEQAIPIENHPGVIQSALLPHTPLLQYYLSFRDRPWNLPFMPMAVHQDRQSKTMKWLHEALHSISYASSAPPITLPPCKCELDYHSKCYWDPDLVLSQQCRYGTYHPKCLGPGPWPFDYSYPHDAWFHNIDFWA